jgi:hypothetical protein
MSGTAGNWWDSAPVVSATPAAPQGNWWDAAPVVQDLAKELGGIVDDPARAAPATTIANASLFPNVQDRIPVYAKALGIPPDKFALSEGQIVYQDPKNPNQYIRVEPSVAGATGPMDALRRVGLYAAGSVGPAIPAVASMAAGIGTRGNLASIAAAGGAGGVADMGRQALGQFINGGNPTDIDYLNSAGQAALGAGGQAVGVGLRSAFERAPVGLASADRAWMRDPANVAAARANADLLRREGITGMQGAVTNRGSLIAADRQMMRNAGTADPMREAVRRINTEEVPEAISRAAGRVYRDEGVDQAARTFRDAATSVIESPRQETNIAARGAFRAAQAEPDQWNAAMRRVLLNDEMQGLYRAAAVRAERDVTLKTPGAVRFPPLEQVNARNSPPFQAWQYMRQELDARAAAAHTARDFNTERQMRGLSGMLDNAIRDVNPAYVQAQTISAPGQQITARLNQGTVGSVAKAGDDAPATEILGKAFDPARTSPAAIAESRQAFVNAGQVDAWDSAFSAHVRSVADKAQRTLASGETGNVAGKIHAELFGTDAKRRAAAAALGGENTPAYREFAETMRAMDIASRVPAMGSQTATDLGQTGAVASPTARAVAAPFRLLSPGTYANLGNRAADAIEGGSASRAAARTAAGYAAGPSANGLLLEGVRIMNPAVAGLLSGGSRGGVGLLPGLLGVGGPPADWQPYQPPPRR